VARNLSLLQMKQIKSIRVLKLINWLIRFLIWLPERLLHLGLCFTWERGSLTLENYVIVIFIHKVSSHCIWLLKFIIRSLTSTWWATTWAFCCLVALRFNAVTSRYFIGLKIASRNDIVFFQFKLLKNLPIFYFLLANYLRLFIEFRARIRL